MTVSVRDICSSISTMNLPNLPWVVASKTIDSAIRMWKGSNESTLIPKSIDSYRNMLDLSEVNSSCNDRCSSNMTSLESFDAVESNSKLTVSSKDTVTSIPENPVFATTYNISSNSTERFWRNRALNSESIATFMARFSEISILWCKSWWFSFFISSLIVNFSEMLTNLWNSSSSDWYL